jgi:hypothetical protein
VFEGGSGVGGRESGVERSSTLAVISGGIEHRTAL